MGRLKQPELIKPEVKPEPKAEVKPPEPKPQPKAKPIAEAQVKIKNTGGRRWWLVGIAGMCIAGGIGGFAIYAGNQNIMLGGLGVILFLVGIGLAYWGFQPQEEGIE